MDPLNLPSILTDAEIVFYGGVGALLVGIVQMLSFVPIPDGSKARAWAVAVIAALFVGLSAPGTSYEGVQLALAIILSWTALASASLGLNRAGSYTISTAKAASEDAG